MIIILFDFFLLTIVVLFHFSYALYFVLILCIDKVKQLIKIQIIFTKLHYL